MRILWVSNSPATCAATAYGGQTALFLPRLRAAGHEVAVFATAGCDGAPQRADDGTLILPRAAHPFGNDIVLGHADYIGADLVLSLLDPHVLDPDVYRQVPWCAWAPVDCSPVSPSAVRALKAARWIWSPSLFGVDQLKAAGLDATYVPHGVDSETFRPMDRVAARAAFGREIGADLNGKFLIAMNAANRENPPRKGFEEAFKAFAMFRREHPSSLLYVHTEARGVFGGIDLLALARDAGVADAVLFPNQYKYVAGMIDGAWIATMYNAADVFLSASHGEGFCLPLVEAAMCGCQSVKTWNTSQPEAPMAVVSAPCTPYSIPSSGVIRHRPDIVAIASGIATARALSMRINHKRQRHGIGYDIDRVFTTHMRPALDRIARELGKQ